MAIPQSNIQERPLVSVGLTTYNRPDRLRRALDSITRQSYSNLEIIVSDNASPGPETNQVIKFFAEHDARIKHFRQETNIGGRNNFLFVLNEARGKYFVWLADDDACDVGYVTELVSCMESNSDYVLAMCDVLVQDEINSITKEEKLTAIRVDKVEKNWRKARKEFFSLPTSNVMFCVCGLYRTDIIRICNLPYVSRWKKMVSCSEFSFLANIAVHGKIVSIPSVLKIYTQHVDSSYIKEVAVINRFDLWVRFLEVRASLLLVALRADLPILERIELFIHALIPSNLHYILKYLNVNILLTRIMKGRLQQ